MVIIAWFVSTVLWVTLWLPVYFIGFLWTWVGLLFCNRDSEHVWFPWWPWDNSHGINGTLDYQNLNWVYLCNPQVNWAVPDPIALAKQIVDDKTGNERKYGKRWLWITWRNPVSNWSMYFMGKKISKPVTDKTWEFGPFVIRKNTCGLLWTYAFTLKYGNGKGFFYSFGWKFTDPVEGIARFLYRISPNKAL